jgi:hypothetical protein
MHNYSDLRRFTQIYACLRILRMLRMKTLDFVPDKIMFAHVTQVYAGYACLRMLRRFTHVYACYACLHMFTQFNVNYAALCELRI